MDWYTGMMSLKQLVFRLSKSIVFIKMIGFLFSHAGFFVPGERLAENDYWYAIRHPKPSYPVHILILPRAAITDWMALPVTSPEIYSAFVALSQQLIRKEGLEAKGYRLIVNGGEYQSIPQLHVHLVYGDPFHQE